MLSFYTSNIEHQIPISLKHQSIFYYSSLKFTRTRNTKKKTRLESCLEKESSEKATDSDRLRQTERKKNHS